MTFPRYFVNIVSAPEGPLLRIYKKASEAESLQPISEDVPIDPPNVAKLIRDLAEYI